MNKNLDTLKETAVQLHRLEDGDRAKLVLESCPAVLVNAVQFLKGLAKESKLPLHPFVTAVINSGLERLEKLQSVAETVEFAASQESSKDQPDEFRVWFAPKLAEALGSFRFYPLENKHGKKLKINFDGWCFWNCQVLSKPLGIKDPRFICSIALMAGFIGYEEYSTSDQEEILHIIKEFSSWVEIRFNLAKEIYKIGEDDSFQGLDQAMPEANGSHRYWEPWKNEGTAANPS